MGTHKLCNTSISVKYSYKSFGHSFVNYLGPVYFNSMPCQYKKKILYCKRNIKKSCTYIIGCFSITRSLRLSPSYVFFICNIIFQTYNFSTVKFFFRPLFYFSLYFATYLI